MYKIVKKQPLNPTVTRMEIEAPLIAKKAKPGQFIILRVDENGERIPLTVAGYDREKGTVTIIFQIVGATTEKLNHLNEGECLHDFVGRRLTVGGKTKFACVDGPDFDGHEVDFDEAMSRSRSYTSFERHAYEEACNLFKKEVE